MSPYEILHFCLAKLHIFLKLKLLKAHVARTAHINKGLHMQPQIYTARTRDYSIEQILLYHQTMIK